LKLVIISLLFMYRNILIKALIYYDDNCIVIHGSMYSSIVISYVMISCIFHSTIGVSNHVTACFEATTIVENYLHVC